VAERSELRLTTAAINSAPPIAATAGQMERGAL
jgi:hypothetical protein